MTDEEQKADLDRRELKWFELHLGWKPAIGEDIDKWLCTAREEDERLCDRGEFPKQCPECNGDYCRACR